MTQTEDQTSVAGLATRGSLGGVLMGLANLVPGISGGTMLLAAGVYTRFIEAIAEVTTLRFRLRSVLLLVVVAAAALLAILLLAGPVKYLVATHRWVMYSLFIGLTFGGVPIVWRMARPARPALFGGTAAGFVVMALMALTKVDGAAGGQWWLLVLGGAAGASAMILPGVSGAYLLLVLGQYEAILGAVDRLKGGDVAGSLGVLVPVSIGIVAGIVGVSNLIRWTLHRYEQATLGVLLGLLFGSVLGIYPFQEFAPAVRHVAGALGLIAAGYLVTVVIDRVSRAAA